MFRPPRPLRLRPHLFILTHSQLWQLSLSLFLSLFLSTPPPSSHPYVTQTHFQLPFENDHHPSSHPRARRRDQPLSWPLRFASMCSGVQDLARSLLPNALSACHPRQRRLQQQYNPVDRHPTFQSAHSFPRHRHQLLS